ncbi:MAG: hypothetical protein FVQ81_03000 [Candidatus Glassbacteria bacterium]|nr:hypothetical protein [Candidatus Glassbacteria bacterium]
MLNRCAVLLIVLFSFSGLRAADYRLSEHPRIFVNPQGLASLADRATGPLAPEYAKIKALADKAVAGGVVPPGGRFRPPMDMVSAGLCYLIERELGNEADKYAEAVKRYWGDGSVLDMDGDGYFGFHGMVFDWIYDALSPAERKTYGDRLGSWLRWYTDTPEITLRNGHWWYNQTWGPAHLNTPNTRDGITPKLFVALGLAGAGTMHEADAVRYLDSWATRVPAECIPAFEEMGAVWSESMGHGGYGPLIVIPWAFEAWRTATGQDLFAWSTPTGYLRGMTRWAVYLTVPFADHTAWIDDNRAGPLANFARVAPILGARYNDPVANWISEKSAGMGWQEVPWNRLLSYDPSVLPVSPGGMDYPLAEFFPGAGHVYMRSGWDDPDATWVFFGAGPKFAGHSRDDEGNFLISKKGWLALRASGPGHNDWDYYAGGSLAFNTLTIYDPAEEFRRTKPGAADGVKNENDGGMIRYVYSAHTRNDRAEIKAYYNEPGLFTCVAADLTTGFRESKAVEVTRQFVYLRAPQEFVVVFDRVEATKAEFPKHWFLHMPGEPSVNGRETVELKNHVFSYSGDQLTSTWLSDPAGEEGVIGKGLARTFLTTLLPAGASLVKRGGEGHDLWGHPDEPTAQYNHQGRRAGQPPLVPWRLEVAAPGGNARDYFLNVFEITDGGVSAAVPVRLVDRQGYLGAAFITDGTPVEITFPASGPLFTRVRVGDREVFVEPWRK